MSTFNDYKVFEDDVINTLKLQFQQPFEALNLVFRYNYLVFPRVKFRDSKSEIDLNEEMYRHFIDSNYRHSFIDCHGDPDEVAKLKEKAVKELKELIEKTQ